MEKTDQENFQKLVEMLEREKARESDRAESRFRELKETFEGQKQELTTQNDGLLGAIGRLHSENDGLRKKVAELEAQTHGLQVELDRRTQDFKIREEVMHRETDIRLMEVMKELEEARDKKPFTPTLTAKQMKAFVKAFGKPGKRGRPKGKKKA